MSDEQGVEARLRRLFAAERTSEAEAVTLQRLRAGTATIERDGVQSGVRSGRGLLAIAAGIALVPAAVAVVVFAFHGGSQPGGQPGGAAQTASSSPVPATSQAVVQTPVAGPTQPTVVQFDLSHMESLRMIDAQHGWAVVNTSSTPPTSIVFTTADAGRTWSLVDPAALLQGHVTVSPVAARDQLRAWIVVKDSAPDDALSGIYRTTDGGRAWSATRVGRATGSLTFLSDSTGFYTEHDSAAGSDAVTIWQTDDRGVTWAVVSQTSSSTGIPFACGKGEIGWRDASTGWVGGSCFGSTPLFDVTRDGGVHWSPQRMTVPPGVDPSGGAFTFVQPVFFGARDGYVDAVAHNADGSEAVFLYATHDGGTTWTFAPAPAGAADVEVVDAGYEVALVTDGRLMASSDDGRHWTLIGQHRELAGATIHPQYLDRNHAFFLVTSVAAAGHVDLYSTDDGGKTLTRP